MPNPGHIPITNQAPGRPGTRAELESAASPPLTSRPSLPYYVPPPRRDRASNIAEAARPEVAAGSDEQNLPDVALASFGSAAASLRNEGILELVIGVDDRVRVSDARMSMNPWRQICALRIRSQTEKTYVGTGWFIAPRVVATAGHCVFLQDEGGWAQSITAIAAKNGPSEPFGRLVSTRVASVDGWTQQRNTDFDYGVIFLDDDQVGQQVGNFEVRTLDRTQLIQTEGQISGYPADRDSAAYQYFHIRPFQDVTDTQLIYDIDTFGGQSGSPIWQDTHELGLVAVGIHTTGGVSSNSGTRITDDVLDTLIQWVTDAANG